MSKQPPFHSNLGFEKEKIMIMIKHRLKGCLISSKQPPFHSNLGFEKEKLMIMIIHRLKGCLISSEESPFNSILGFGEERCFILRKAYKIIFFLGKSPKSVTQSGRSQQKQ